MKNKNNKIVLKIAGSELNALVANAGYFEACDGMMEKLFKIGTVYLNEQKLHVTEVGIRDMYSAILMALESPKYPGKKGAEYNALVNVSKLIESEYERQTGKEFNL